MDSQVELEVCANCKREIPHTNYVMHTVHCARNITLCSTCKEPIPKADFEKHKCVAPPKPKTIIPPSKLEASSYFKAQKEIEDKRVTERQARRLERLERLVGNTTEPSGHVASAPKVEATPPFFSALNYDVPIGSSKSTLMPCQYCELELPKFDLAEHEAYCGACTERCEDCGERVMYKDRNAHRDSNHQRKTTTPREILRPLSALSLTGGGAASSLETSKEISRRLDCKTEYIRNLLHDTASITAPLRSTGAIRRNNSRTSRRRDPPTEIVIPCEFCNTPVPHEDLIEHETGCRPDLARYKPLRREISPEPYPARGPSSPDVEIPCEFCSDLIPASQFLNHQATCSCN